MLCLGISSLILISFSLTVLGLGSGVAGGGGGGTIVRGYLRLTLVLVSASTLREGFNFCFSSVFGH